MGVVGAPPFPPFRGNTGECVSMLVECVSMLVCECECVCMCIVQQ